MTGPRTDRPGSQGMRLTRRLGVLTVSGVFALAACGASTSGGGARTTTRPRRCASPSRTTTVRYASIPGVRADATSLDVYAPVKPCHAPVVMWVHGGGYHVGDKRNQIADKARLFNARGWLLVSVNYRLTAAGDASSAHYPDHYEDVAAAVAWVHAHIGEFGGDRSRVALLGHSAGADIVANVTTNPQYLQYHGLGLRSLRCAGPLDTEGFDKATANAAGSGEKGAWLDALGNAPDYERTTSAITWIRSGSGIPATIGVVRGTRTRRTIEQTYLDRLAAGGTSVTRIDASSLSHAQVNSRIGAAGDTVMTPPLLRFLRGCFR